MSVTVFDAGEGEILGSGPYQPAGNEHYLKELGQLAATGSPPSPEVMADIASRYDFESVERE